jgi:hypothetical protein
LAQLVVDRQEQALDFDWAQDQWSRMGGVVHGATGFPQDGAEYQLRREGECGHANAQPRNATALDRRPRNRGPG